MSAPHLRTVFLVEQSRPGASVGRLVTLDDRIVIDDYYPADDPNVRWYCDNCGEGQPVTAQFNCGEAEAQYVTLCRACLQRAIDGIDHSLAHPKSEDVV